MCEIVVCLVDRITRDAYTEWMCCVCGIYSTAVVATNIVHFTHGLDRPPTHTKTSEDNEKGGDSFFFLLLPCTCSGNWKVRWLCIRHNVSLIQCHIKQWMAYERIYFILLAHIFNDAKFPRLYFVFFFSRLFWLNFIWDTPTNYTVEHKAHTFLTTHTFHAVKYIYILPTKWYAIETSNSSGWTTFWIIYFQIRVWFVCMDVGWCVHVLWEWLSVLKTATSYSHVLRSLFFLLIFFFRFLFEPIEFVCSKCFIECDVRFLGKFVFTNADDATLRMAVTCV